MNPWPFHSSIRSGRRRVLSTVERGAADPRDTWAEQRLTGWFVWTLVSFFVICGFQVSVAEEAIDFESRIAPLLIRRCVECHQGKNPLGGLLLTTRNGLHAGGDSGPVIDLESVDESELLRRVVDGEMPPEKQGRSQRLPDDEIKHLKAWIVGGAKWPKGRELDYFERTNELRAGRDWWSLQPVVRPNLPQLAHSPRPRKSDRCVRASEA